MLPTGILYDLARSREDEVRRELRREHIRGSRIGGAGTRSILTELTRRLGCCWPRKSRTSRRPVVAQAGCCA